MESGLAVLIWLYLFELIIFMSSFSTCRLYGDRQSVWVNDVLLLIQIDSDLLHAFAKRNDTQRRCWTSFWQWHDRSVLPSGTFYPFQSRYGPRHNPACAIFTLTVVDFSKLYIWFKKHLAHKPTYAFNVNISWNCIGMLIHNHDCTLKILERDRKGVCVLHSIW